MSRRALVQSGPEPDSLALVDLPDPEPGPDDVVLDVAAVSVCGSDVHQWQGQHTWPMRYPVVIGHEFAGTVVTVGERVTGWRPGDRVVSETHAHVDPDGALTRQGLYNLDPSRRGFGASVDGGMTTRASVPARCLHRLPDHLPFDQAALTEPACVAYNAVVGNSRVRPGDRVVVLGPGPIGVLCAAVARLSGAEVALVGLPRDAQRLQAAQAYDVTPLVDGVRDWCTRDGWDGADLVVDATGVSASLRTALDVVRPNGAITKVGWSPQPLDYSLDPLIQKNVRLQGSFSHNWPIWERVVHLLATGMLDVAPLIGGVWPLEAWRDAFEAMHAGTVVKAVLQP